MNKVELIGVYGSDVTHAQSAWTSTTRDLKGKRKRIPALLKMLAENGHHTPFEKSSLHFLVDCEVASHIHLLKHRIGVSINGESARYKELKETRMHSPADWPVWYAVMLDEHYEKSVAKYKKALQGLEAEGFSRKRAKESARFFLPYCNVTTVDVMFNFRSFMHFQGLRNKPDAQMEIKDIARSMLKLVMDTKKFKHSLAAFGYSDGIN